MKNSIKLALNQFLPAAVVITLLSGFFFLGLNQNYRSSANDPQIQYIQGIVDYLTGAEAKPEDVTGTQKISVENSLDPFIIIFDTERKSVAANAQLKDGTPIPPEKRFEIKKDQNKFFSYFSNNGQKRFTWVPQKGVKIAAVLDSYEKDGKLAGYVLVGRNLKEIEKRTVNLGLLVTFGWLITMVSTFTTILMVNLRGSKKTEK